MDIQKEFLSMQIAYEKNCAIRCNCSYEELKAQLDKSESLFGTRYLEDSPRHENWLLWVQAWQAAQKVTVPEGFVLDKPAKVGNGTFGIGVKWSTVISVAQRQFEYAQNDEKANVQDLKGILFDVPEGFVLIANNSKTVVAIEKIVEQQVEASGISQDVFRLDGYRILEAMIEAQEQVG